MELDTIEGAPTAPPLTPPTTGNGPARGASRGSPGDLDASEEEAGAGGVGQLSAALGGLSLGVDSSSAGEGRSGTRPGPTEGATAGGQGSRVGLLLDLHGLEILAKQRSVAQESWSAAGVEALERQLLAAVGLAGEGEQGEPGPLAASGVFLPGHRIAVDSSVPIDEAGTYKVAVHSALAAAGYALDLQPNKRATAEDQQGAVDVSVVTRLFHLAGAFQTAAPVDHVVLVSSDSDFRPAVAAVLQGRPGLHVWVCTEAGSTSKPYLAWLQGRELCGSGSGSGGDTPNPCLHWVDTGAVMRAWQGVISDRVDLNYDCQRGVLGRTEPPPPPDVVADMRRALQARAKDARAQGLLSSVVFRAHAGVTRGGLRCVVWACCASLLWK
jgi:hypothetical protein